MCHARPSARLAREHEAAREPALGGEAAGDREEGLLALVRGPAFDLDEIPLPRPARLFPPRGQKGDGVGQVFLGEQLEARATHEPGVLARRNEEEERDGAPHGQLVGRDRARHDARIREEQPSSGLQNARPLGDHALAAGKMVDSVHTGDGIEGTARKRQREPGVVAEKLRTPREVTPLGVRLALTAGASTTGRPTGVFLEGEWGS